MKKLIPIAAAVAAIAALPSAADAHRSGYHRYHICPSDHATYTWHGMYCVSPSSGESTSGYGKRVVFQGRVYYCQR